MKHRKTQLAAAVGAALLVGGTAAHAQTVAPGQPLAVTLYGQVHRALMWADDGVQNKIFHVDGQSSSTRFGIRAASQLTPGLRAGAQFEVEMRSNRADGVRMGSEVNDATLGERWLDLFFEGGWGRINIGQGSGAADDASAIDLSGTGLVNGLGVGDWGGGLRFRTPAGGTTTGTAGPFSTAATTIGSVLNNYDFESRYDRVAYTTPTFGGFRAQAGFGYKGCPSDGCTAASDVKEASLWYSGKIAGTLQAAIGWSQEDAPSVGGVPVAGADKNETIGGSVSWLHTSGFNVTLQHTQAENHVSSSSRDPDNFLGKAKHSWIKLGYKFGRHAIAVDYALAKDEARAGDEANSTGIGYVWTPVAWAELYAGFSQVSLDRPGVSLEDIRIGRIGSRIRF